MLKESTEKLANKMDNLMDKMIKESMSKDAVQHMEMAELEIIQDALDCWEMCNKIMVEQAAVLDQLNEKMDILLQGKEAKA